MSDIPCLCPRPTAQLEQALVKLRNNPAKCSVVNEMIARTEKQISIAIRGHDTSCPLCMGQIPAEL